MLSPPVTGGAHTAHKGKQCPSNALCMQANGWGQVSILFFTHHILSAHFPLVVPMLLHGHVRPLPCYLTTAAVRAASDPLCPHPARRKCPPPGDVETDPVLPIRPKWPAKMAPSFLFSFFKDVVEIPRRARFPVRVMAPPPLRGDSRKANLRGFFLPIFMMVGLQSIFYIRNHF